MTEYLGVNCAACGQTITGEIEDHADECPCTCPFDMAPGPVVHGQGCLVLTTSARGREGGEQTASPVAFFEPARVTISCTDGGAQDCWVSAGGATCGEHPYALEFAADGRVSRCPACAAANAAARFASAVRDDLNATMAADLARLSGAPLTDDTAAINAASVPSNPQAARLARRLARARRRYRWCTACGWELWGAENERRVCPDCGCTTFGPRRHLNDIVQVSTVVTANTGFVPLTAAEIIARGTGQPPGGPVADPVWCTWCRGTGCDECEGAGHYRPGDAISLVARRPGGWLAPLNPTPEAAQLLARVRGAFHAFVDPNLDWQQRVARTRESGRMPHRPAAPPPAPAPPPSLLRRLLATEPLWDRVARWWRAKRGPSVAQINRALIAGHLGVTTSGLPIEEDE